MFTEVANSVGPDIKEYVGYGTAAVGVAGLAFKAYTNVPQGQVGLRTRFKRARQEKDSILPWGPKAGEIYKLVGPGPHLTMPFAHNINLISTQDRTTALPAFRVDSGQAARQHDINASIIWGVVKPEDAAKYGIEYKELVMRAMYEASSQDELTEAVTGICVTGLRKVILSENEPHKINPDAAQQNLISSCKDDLLGYGVELRRLNVINTAYTNADVLGSRLAGAQFAIGAAAAAYEIMPELRVVPTPNGTE